jgi:hypothetical protein
VPISLDSISPIFSQASVKRSKFSRHKFFDVQGQPGIPVAIKNRLFERHPKAVNGYPPGSGPGHGQGHRRSAADVISFSRSLAELAL